MRKRSVETSVWPTTDHSLWIAPTEWSPGMSVRFFPDGAIRASFEVDETATTRATTTTTPASNRQASPADVERIRRLLERGKGRKGWIARKLGVSHRYLFYLSSGKRIPSRRLAANFFSDPELAAWIRSL